MSSRLTAKQTHKKTLRACQVLITTHMSRASRRMNRSVLESAQIRVCDLVSVNIGSGDLLPTVDTSAPTAPPPCSSLHQPHSSNTLRVWLEVTWQSAENSNVYPRRNFGRFIVEVGARHPHCTQQTQQSLLTRSASFQQIKAAVCVMRDQINTTT